MGRVALIGLDGATYRVLDPMIDAGAMPALAALRRRGTSGLIGAPTLWQMLNHMSIDAGVFNVPMTYPASDVRGFMVSGGVAAGWTKPELPNFTKDPAVGRLVAKAGGSRYPVDTPVNYEKDWDNPVVVSEIERIQGLRRTVLKALLENFDVSYLFAVFEGPDRLMHLHYQHIVECSDMYGKPRASEVRERAYSYFGELDRAIHDLVEWAGPDGHVVVVSDHGFGPWEKTVNTNLILEGWGFLKMPATSRLTRSRFVAGTVQRVSRHVLPRRFLLKLKATVGSKINWDESKAFASHVAEQGVHINERGVFLPRGFVEPSEVARLEDDLIDRFCHYRDDGEDMTDQVVRRSEVIHGPHAGRAPNLFPVCRDQRYELSDTLAAAGPVTDHRNRPWGYHHSDGVFIAAGPGTRTGPLDASLDIVDVLPTTFRLAGLRIPTGLDGKAVDSVLTPEAASIAAEYTDMQLTGERNTEYPFSQEEEAAIEDQLRGLGYLE